MTLFPVERERALQPDGGYVHDYSDMADIQTMRDPDQFAA